MKKRIVVELSDQEIDAIQSFLDDTKGREHSSSGELTISALAEMLLRDVAMAVSRPGSWEGSNMIDVLRSHGYWE